MAGGTLGAAGKKFGADDKENKVPAFEPRTTRSRAAAAKQKEEEGKEKVRRCESRRISHVTIPFLILR